MAVSFVSIDLWSILLRLLLAAFLGGIIGWEREQRHKQAGFKTHLLVALGACLIMLISIYGFEETLNHPNARFDPARIAAQVVSGIGFLGAGAILRHPNMVVTGLTTAATLWVVAAIGLSVGSGFFIPAVATTVIVLLSMVVLRGVESRIVRSRRYKELTLVVSDRPGKLGEITTLLGSENVDIRSVSMAEGSGDETTPFLEMRFRVRVSPRLDFVPIVYRLRQIEGVREVQYDD